MLQLTYIVSDFKNDNFDKVIGGEIRYNELLFKEINPGNLKARLSSALFLFKHDEERGLFELLQNIGTFFAPHFLFKKEKVNNAVYTKRAQDIASVRMACEKIDHSHYNSNFNIRNQNLFQHFKSNAVGEMLIEELHPLDFYFLRRCQDDFHLQAVRVALTITQFESIKNYKIKSLDELIPNFLSKVPIDATNGRALSFNPKKRWLYSVGDNFLDQGGSENTFHHVKCNHDK